MSRARKSLLKKGLLKVHDGHLRITPRGISEFRRREARLSLGQKKKWDGRWRVLIFDVPERRKVVRDKIRRTLDRIGFERLQDSVWVYPYDCEDFIALLKADFKIGKDVLYMIVDEMEGDAEIRCAFKLPSRT